MKFDLVEAWLDNVSISHSNSSGTREGYKHNFLLFCNFIGRTPEEIVRDYDNSKDREFRRRYAQYLRAFLSAESKKGLSPGTISSRETAVKSFFKYNDLLLGFVPRTRVIVIHHNRDLTHEELKLILGASRPREKAFFAILAQSGLRPSTICSLKFKHVKEDLVEKRIPCKIDVPQEIAKGKYRGYFTFISHEAVEHLKAYLNTRRNLRDEDFLFVKEGTTQKANPKSLSGLFSRTLQKLQGKGLIDVEQKARSKPRDVRLYNLRKFFRKHATPAGFGYVHFWMGHIVRTGQEEHYRPTDVEFHRKLYAEKAMPFLRLETATPIEAVKTIRKLEKQLEERDKEVKAMKEKMAERDQEFKAMGEMVAKIQPLVDFVNSFNHPKELKKILDFLKDDSMIQSSYDPKIHFDKTISDKLDEIVKKEGITRAEALEQLAKEEWKTHEQADEKRKKSFKARGLPITKEDYEKQKKKKVKK